MTATATKPRKARAGGTSLQTATLKAALAAVSAAVPSRSPKPILLNVLLEDGAVTASDLELQITAEIDYAGEPLVLPFGRLQAILGNASGDSVTLTHGGTKCTIEIGRGKWDLPTEDAAEFPKWEPTGLKRICTLPADQFRRAEKAVIYAADSKSSRYALGGVMVEVDRKKSRVYFVSTDGRRLASYHFEISNNEDPDSSQTLVPASAMKAMATLAKDSIGAVQVDANGNEMVAEIDGTVVTSRLIDGRFPPWRDAIQDRKSIKATVVNGADLLSATKAAAVCTSEQSKGVTFSFANDGIHLNAQSAEAGQASVDCEVLEPGDAVSVQMDPHFVADFLRGVDEAEPVEVEAVDHASAVVFRCGDCTGVVMPLSKD